MILHIYLFVESWPSWPWHWHFGPNHSSLWDCAVRSGVWQKPWTLTTRCQAHPPRHNNKVCCQMFPGRGESPLVEKWCFIILLAFCHFSSSKHSMLSLDSVLKSRDVTLPTKVHIVKAMFFSSSHVWTSLVAQCGRPRFIPWVGKISWRRK